MASLYENPYQTVEYFHSVELPPLLNSTDFGHHWYPLFLWALKRTSGVFDGYGPRHLVQYGLGLGTRVEVGAAGKCPPMVPDRQRGR